ncbi:MAG: AAA family ATPase [Caldilineaceae bacterium]
MLGTLQVTRGDHLVTETDWHTRQARQLLKILVTERPRPVSTDRLIEILWPDSTPQAAATTLRSAINSLRNVLEPERPNRAPSQYILTQMPGYAFYLHPDIWLDVEDFEHKLNSAQTVSQAEERQKLLEAAIDLYRDDYLISDPYADWAENERDRLRERFFGALLQVADSYAQVALYPAAIAACRRILAQDEVRENAYQSLMRYLAESGDSAAALLAYEKCREILANELGADPSPLTQKLHERILNGEIQPRTIQVLEENREMGRWGDGEKASPKVEHPHIPISPSPHALPQLTFMPALDATFLDLFVGRDQEIAVMEQALAQAIAGKGNLLLLEGEAGVGKTRLAYATLQQAAQSGSTVISAACQALEHHLPFAPLADAIGRYIHTLPTAALHSLPHNSLSQLAQIVPSLQDRIPALPVIASSGAEIFTLANENRQRLIDGIVAFLTALATLRPLVLFLDDLHWADPDTLAVLGRLAQRVSDAPFFLMLAYRSDELADNEALNTLLHALKRTQSQRTVAVHRLAQAQVHQYVVKLMGGEQTSALHPLTSVLYETTHGNALFVTEALRDLQERQSSGSSDRQPESMITPNWGSEPMLLMTLRRNRRVQEIVEERISRLPEAAYAVLQVGAVIGRDFSLELLEQAFIADPLEGLEVLLQRNFLIERPDQRLDFSHQVVRQATYDGMSNLQRRRWHLRVADALVKLHRDERNPSEVAFHYSQAGDGARPQYAQFSVKAGEWLLRSFGFRQALLAFDRALEIFESLPDSSPALVQRALQGRGLAYESLFDPEGMTKAYRRLQQWASERGDRNLLLTTYSRLTSMLALFGQQRESNELLQELVTALAQTNETRSRSRVVNDLLQRRQIIYGDLRQQKDDAWSPFTPPPPVVADPVADLLHVFEPVHAVLPLFDYGWTLLVQGQLGEATYCLQKVVDLANETAQPSIASTAYHQLAVTARILGDSEQSQVLNEKSVAINRTVPGAASELASMWPRIASGFLSLQAGRVEEAERRLRRVLDFLGERKTYATYRNSANIGLGLVLLARGEPEDAKALLQAALADSGNFYPYTHVRALLGLAEIAAQEGDLEECAKILRQALHFAGKRSLLEEYLSIVMAIARLQPTGAPLQELSASLLDYVRSIGLESAERLLSGLV